MKTLRERFGALPAASPADGLRLRAGSMGDYLGLAEFHYLRNRPATATRVLVLEDERPAIAARFRGPSEDGMGKGGPAGASLADGDSARTSSEDSACPCHPPDACPCHPPVPAAVLVESLPALSCALRDEALGGRYRGWGDRGAAARLLNAEVRCISRVVVHPQWRGLGLAVRLVREALASMTTPYTEALAAMGRVHPFFERAGMRAYRRWPLERDQRLIDALRWAGVEAWELASVERARRAVEAEGTGLLRRELRRWAGRGATFEEQLGKARERLMCEPIYYVKRMTND